MWQGSYGLTGLPPPLLRWLPPQVPVPPRGPVCSGTLNHWPRPCLPPPPPPHPCACRWPSPSSRCISPTAVVQRCDPHLCGGIMHWEKVSDSWTEKPDWWANTPLSLIFFYYFYWHLFDIMPCEWTSLLIPLHISNSCRPTLRSAPVWRYNALRESVRFLDRETPTDEQIPLSVLFFTTFTDTFFVNFDIMPCEWTSQQGQGPPL